MSFFRYPGGKSKLSTHIINKLVEYYVPYGDYCEPFFGGGSIGMELLSKYNFNAVTINDKDVGIYCLWSCIVSYPDSLKELIKTYKPSVEDFYKFKEELLQLSTVPDGIPADPNMILKFGFKKLVIHQISYSGLGTMSGGPLGGSKQASKYKIDCRWSPSYMCNKIDKLHKTFKRHATVYCMSLDVSWAIQSLPYQTLVYLDPPYYNKGDSLYQIKFTKEDHRLLAELLKTTNHKWVLSYDDCPEVRELYNWANVQEISANYTIRTSRVKKELIISAI